MRISWIDELRGFCMMAILWFHTEVYYAGTDITPYAFYVGDVLAVFFFLSGYLFYRDQAFSLRRKVCSILRRLVVPYLFFTLLMAVPKALVHGDSLAPFALLTPIVTGQASWFVSTLIVSELFFSVVIYITKGRPWLMAGIALAMLIIASFNLASVQLFSLSSFLLFVGYFYHRYEERLVVVFVRPYIIILL